MTDKYKINSFCGDCFDLTLEELIQPHRTGHLTSNRKILLTLLTYHNKWSSKQIGKLLNRGAANIRKLHSAHKTLLEVDAEYKEQYSAILEKWEPYKVTINVSTPHGNFKQMKLTDLKTKKVHHFKSITATAKHLKCSNSLISLYKKQGISEFLGYKIVYL